MIISQLSLRLHGNNEEGSKFETIRYHDEKGDKSLGTNYNWSRRE